MLKRVLGKKVGMTQIFNAQGNAIPVTVIDVGNWFVTQVKTLEKDGYPALQLGLLKKKHYGKKFDSSWLKAKRNYFSILREVKIDVEDENKFSVAQPIKLTDSGLKEGCFVDVSGVSIGLGFQGVVKRWGFAGGPASHGSTFHRKPGSVGNLCSCGVVMKGKKMPGQCGNKKITTSGLNVERVDAQDGYLFVKGAVPGKKNSLVYVRMQG